MNDLREHIEILHREYESARRARTDATCDSTVTPETLYILSRKERETLLSLLHAEVDAVESAVQIVKAHLLSLAPGTPRNAN